MDESNTTISTSTDVNESNDMETEESSTEELLNYLKVIKSLPKNVLKKNKKLFFEELNQLQNELEIDYNKPSDFQILNDIRSYIETHTKKKRKSEIITETENIESKKQLSILEKLKINTQSIIDINMQSNVLINGITKSGKSTFISNLFSQKFWSFSSMIENVYLFSKIDVQEAWINLQKNCDDLNIKLHIYKAIDSLYDLQKIIPQNSVLIVDDFMVDAIKDKKLMNLLTDLFNVTTHHNNIISIFTLHNLFADGFRTMRLNSDYIFLFSNPVDINSVKFFFRQLENEQKAQLLFIAYKKALSDSVAFGIQIMKNLEHKYFYGFSNLIMFLNDDELSQIQKNYTLINHGADI